MKHTEGEWYWGERDGTIYVRSNSSKGDIAHILVKGDTTKSLSEKVANTQIITAAPDLLKACKDARNVLIFIALLITTETKLPELIARLDNVINQAEGE